MLERKIIIGMIVSADFLKQIRNIWNPLFIQSAAARRIAQWAWEYFEKYEKAAGKNIESIFFQHQKKIPKELAEEIEEDILPSLSREYSSDSFNLVYTLDETQKYFKDRHLEIHCNQIENFRNDQKLDKAEQTACEYRPLQNASQEDLDFSDEIVLERVDKAFDETGKSIIMFPGQMGYFLNEHLVKGGFVAFMGTEKRGKTYMLLEFAIRAVRQGRKVAFFQAGDMTEGQLLKRICIYLAQKSDKKKYCGEMFEPVRDCILNQKNDCEKPERVCDFGIFEGYDFKEIRDEITVDQLVEAMEEFPEYCPCTKCADYEKQKLGAAWIEKIPETDPLNRNEAKELMNQFFVEKERQLRVSTHPNDTLTLSRMKSILSMWEKQDDFIPEVIIVDYADILETEERLDERPKQNKIWKGLRRLSQEKGQPLVITVTQADAAAYEKIRLGLKNFSEDKRKYAHVTAMWGLNQDPKGREKKIGLLRINELTVREGDFLVANEVIILQNLRRGRPFLGSFW